MLLTIFILFLDWTEQDQENKNMEIDCHYRRVDNQIKK